MTQETFERAFQARDRFDPAKGAMKTWLLTIARNVYIDSRRRGSARREVLMPAAGEGAAVEGDGGPTLGPEPETLAALALLSRREREVIALRFGGDLRASEIADLLGISVANAQQILSRALRRMRSILEAPPEAGPVTQTSPQPDRRPR